MDFSYHKLQSVCSSKSLSVSTVSRSSTSVLKNVNGVDSQIAAELSSQDEVLEKSHNKIESNVKFSLSSTIPTYAATAGCTSFSTVAERIDSTRYTKKQQEILERILDKLYIAYQNLSPVIDEIINSATECTAPDTQTFENSDCPMCSVTHEQYIAAIKASQLIQEVNNEVIQSAKYNMGLIKGEIIHFPTADFIVNTVHQSIYTKLEETPFDASSPRIYIEKHVVDQLIELYDLLHGAIQQLYEIARLKRIPISKHTNRILNKTKNCKTLLKSKTAFKQSNLTSTVDIPENSKELAKLQEEYRGLSDAVDMLKSIIQETSGSVGDIKKNEKILRDTRRTKSDNSVIETEKSKKITDASGARRCILDCLIELAEVRKYLKSLNNTKELDIISQICLTGDPKKECCSRQNIPHLHAKLNGIPIVVKLNQDTLDTILSSVGSNPRTIVNEDSNGIIGSCQKYKCIASKSSPICKTSDQSTKMISSDKKELSSKPRQEYGCKQKVSTEPELELPLKKMKFCSTNKNQKNSIKPKIRPKSVTEINEKPILPIFNKTYKSLNSLLYKQRPIRKRSRSSSSKDVPPKSLQVLKQNNVNQGDCLATKSATRISLDNRESLEDTSTREKTLEIYKPDTALEKQKMLKKKSKQSANTSKRNASGVTYILKYSSSGKLLEMSCYTKRKCCKCYIGNSNPEIKSLNKFYSKTKPGTTKHDNNNCVNEENDVNKIRNRTDNLVDIFPVENINDVYYASDYKLPVDGNKQKADIKSSHSFITNKVIETRSDFSTSLNASSEQQKVKLPDDHLVEENINGMYEENATVNHLFTSSVTQQEIITLPETFPLQKANNEPKENYSLGKTFANKTDQQSNKLLGCFSTNNISDQLENRTKVNTLFIAGIKTEKTKKGDDFIEKHNSDKHKRNDNPIKSFTSNVKQRDNVRLADAYTAKRIGRENCNLIKSFTNKIKQQKTKRHNKFSSKLIDSIPEEADNLSRLLTDEVKQQEILNLVFNDFLVNNASNLQKENDNSSLNENINSLNKENDVFRKPITFKEQVINKLIRNSLNNTPETYYKLNKLLNNKNKQRIINYLSNKLTKGPEESNGLWYKFISGIKQKEIIKLYNSFLTTNKPTKNDHLNMSSSSASKQEKTMKSSINSANDVDNSRCNMLRAVQNNLTLKKSLQYKTLTSETSKNTKDVNRLSISKDANPRFESNATLKFSEVNELWKSRNRKSQSKNKQPPKSRLHKKNINASAEFKSESLLSIPYVVSATSIPKLKMERARPKLKVITKTTSFQSDGIHYPNKKIQRQLEVPFPAECCRKTVLNEKSQIGLPYQVSLASLPSDDADIDVIKKTDTKHKSARRQCNSSYKTCYSKLNYYSNLETNFKQIQKKTYEVHYFELETNFQSENQSVPSAHKIKKETKASSARAENNPPQQKRYSFDKKSATKSTNNTSEYSKYPLPWGQQSFEVRVFEIVRKSSKEVSDTDMPMAMSDKKSIATYTEQQPREARMSKSKYYSYPDEEDYFRVVNRKSVGEKRADEDFPKLTNRRTDASLAIPHRHGESRLGLQPWAPFSISDTSLPDVRASKKKALDDSSYQGKDKPGVPKTASRDRDAKRLNQNQQPVLQSDISNQSKGASPRIPKSVPLPLTNQNEEVNPIILTPELLARLTRTPQDVVNPMRINFTPSTDYYDDSYLLYRNNMPPADINNVLHTSRGNLKSFPVKMCTVCTDTDDIDFEFPQKGPRTMADASIQKRPSYCRECATSQKAHKAEFSQKPSQYVPCSKESEFSHKPNKLSPPEQPSTSKDHSKWQSKRNAKKNELSKEKCQCATTKELCICSNSSNCKLTCGKDGFNKDETINQKLHSCIHQLNSGNYKYKEDKSDISTHNQNKSLPHCAHPQTSKKTGNSKRDQQKEALHKNCSEFYNQNPNVMYYLGEQRNINFRSNCSSKPPTSLEHLATSKNISVGIDTGTQNNPKWKSSVNEQNNKTQKLKIHQDNIVQYCFESQTNISQVPFRNKTNHPLTDLSKNESTNVQQDYNSHKIQTDTYYLLCLPNEPLFSSKEFLQEKNNHARFSHNRLISHDNNIPQQIQDEMQKYRHFNKRRKSHCEFENIPAKLKSYLNSSDRKGQGFVKSNGTVLKSNKSVNELAIEKYNDSTVYVFQVQPKLNSYKYSINQRNQPILIRQKSVSTETKMSDREKMIINGKQLFKKNPNEEAKTEYLEDRNFQLKSDLSHHQVVNQTVKVNNHEYSENEKRDNIKSKKFNTLEHISKGWRILKEDYKHNIFLVTDSHNHSRMAESSKHRRYHSRTHQKQSQGGEFLKHIQYCSVGTNTEYLLNETLSETSTLRQDYSDKHNPSAKVTESNSSERFSKSWMPPEVNLTNYKTNLEYKYAVENSPYVYEVSPKICTGWSQHPNTLLRQVGPPAVAKTAAKLASNMATEKNELINNRSSTKTMKSTIHLNIKSAIQQYNDVSKKLISGWQQDITSTQGLHTFDESKRLTEDNFKEIQGVTSKYSIVISQLTDASTCTQNASIIPSPQFMKDVNKRTQYVRKKKHPLYKHNADMQIEHDHFYYESEEVPICSSKSTQSPPVTYRSKLSDFIKKGMPRCQSSKIFTNIKLERENDNWNLVNQQPHNIEKNEKLINVNFAVTSMGCRTQADRVLNYSKSQEWRECSICPHRWNLVDEQANHAKSLSCLINNNFNSKITAPVQFADGSQQTDDSYIANQKSILNSYSREVRNNIDPRENSSIINRKRKPLDKRKSSNIDLIIGDAFKAVLRRKSSNSMSDKLTAPFESSDSEICIGVYKSRLFGCSSQLSLPLQLENKRSTTAPNSFWIPPDYDQSEFNLFASDSSLSNRFSLKENSGLNISGQSSIISDANEVEYMYNTNKENTCVNNLLNRNSNNRLKGRTYSFATLRRKYQKASFPDPIIPVRLALSQQECQEVSSVPAFPVTLAVQQEYQKAFPSAPSKPSTLSPGEVRSSLNFLFQQTDVFADQLLRYHNSEVYVYPTRVSQQKSHIKMNTNPSISSTKLAKSSQTHKQCTSKQPSFRNHDCDECNSLKTSKCCNQTVGKMECDKNSDSVYWALTRVKRQIDGSQDFEILETTPIPPGHFLIPTANSVILVGNQPYVTENKEINGK